MCLAGCGKSFNVDYFLEAVQVRSLKLLHDGNLRCIIGTFIPLLVTLTLWSACIFSEFLLDQVRTLCCSIYIYGHDHEHKCIFSLSSGEITDTFLPRDAKPFMLAFSLTVCARSLKLCVMITSVHLYIFTLVLWPWPIFDLVWFFTGNDPAFECIWHYFSFNSVYRWHAALAFMWSKHWKTFLLSYRGLS